MGPLFCQQTDRPNVILIMSDDMGYECLGSYGSLAYQTPVLDSLAQNGLRFANCISQPLCTPSRVKLMTGQYNYRNYTHFGFLPDDQYTFGNLMRDAGYSTAIVGKWQLNGLAYKKELPQWKDASRPNAFGFDEYCLWQLTATAAQGERFSDPLIEANGKFLERDPNAYGPDLFTNYILDFIERKKAQPFFVYYPMVLVHNPFVPTPNSPEWQDPALRTKQDPRFFADMVSYTDTLVGRIMAKLKALELDQNTLVIFLGDNGTNKAIRSRTDHGNIRGGKGNTTDAGTHVPFIAYWPQGIGENGVETGLIEFSDFFATLNDMVDGKHSSDGQSFLKRLTGTGKNKRDKAFVHYDPLWGKNVNQYRNQFVRNLGYKLYANGQFFHVAQDTLEKRPLLDRDLERKQKKIKTALKKELARHPVFE
ncbi:hypothetical protein B7P33_03975 [Sediminicola luteus]|uniref:Sulfatase N-terminal domain-containing protein n=2 Tax=Sediminicola luteus TaxID=319238 RepID=A0A2A4GFE1_9FLAO|nr:hypothetical protein B7P33_03975 [Sediminicola luteus]